MSTTSTEPALELTPFDAADYLKDEADITAYINLALEDGDPALLLAVLGDAARARGMTQVAEQSGLTREALYQALRPTSRPQFSTVARVMRALGIRLVAQAEQTG